MAGADTDEGAGGRNESDQEVELTAAESAADIEAAIEQALAKLSAKIAEASSTGSGAGAVDGGGRLEDLDIFLFLKTNVEAYRRVMGLISRLKSPSLRPRHWRHISKLCGFTPDSTSLLYNRTYDEVAAIFLEKDHRPIVAVIETAKDESEIEERLAGMYGTSLTKCMHENYLIKPTWIHSACTMKT